ncbi:hypothetical protein ACX3O0_08965 [Homoserinimonas sp. A447]
MARSPEQFFRILGAGWVIAGGLVAAVTGPLQLENGSWAAAFCVLVAGVAQYAIGVVQAALASKQPTRRVVVAQLATWNGGCAAVILGTVLTMLALVHVGGLLLITALVLLIVTVRGNAKPRWALVTYRALLVIILASIPIGLAIAHVRAG